MLPARFRRLCGHSRWTKKYGLLALAFVGLFMWLSTTLFPRSVAEHEEVRQQQLLDPGPVHVDVPLPPKHQPVAHKVRPTLGMGIDEQILVLVMSANRPQAVRNHLNQLLRLRPSAQQFPILISQDGDSSPVTSAIKEYVNETAHISFIHHKTKNETGMPKERGSRNYFFIAQHYKWALDKVVKEMGYKTILITEDDLDLAEDFFSYFSATKHLLYDDPTVWCVSAWNDNGNPKIADRKRSEQLYRTDFFPGLGWMMTSKLWLELSDNWPSNFWDDWLRRQDTRKDRVCIRPEVSRTVHNMQVAGKGSSGGMYKAYLSSMQLPEAAVDFSLVDVDRLKKQRFDADFGQRILDAKPISMTELNASQGLSSQNAYRVIYNDPREFRQISKKFKLMYDIRSGMARTAYYGVVPFMLDGVRIYLVHKNLDLTKPFGAVPSRSVYDEKWDLMSRYLDFAELYCRASRWTGKCDPKDPGMIEWFRKRNQMKRLEAWGEMIVF